MDYVEHLIIVFLNSRYKYNVYQVFRRWENKNTVKAQHKSDYITSIILRILIGIQMNIGSNKHGLCYPFNVQVYIYIYLINGFHMHRYLLILLDSALNTVGENVEYTKKKMWQQCKNESLYVLHCCTYQGFFKLGVQVLSLVCAKN